MELSFDLGVDCVELEDEKVKSELEIVQCTEETLVPKKGNYLGLDLSKLSTGICLYKDGVKVSANSSLTVSKEDEFKEVRLRRQLKHDLAELISGMTFELILVEDAFQGVNPNTTRLLYAINTAIDEMILDREIYCKKFMRPSNQLWKSWLFSIDTEGYYVGLDDKLRIQKCLELLGVYEDISVEGYQDRLDSCGMLLGYFMHQADINSKIEEAKIKRVSWSDICCAFEYEDEFVVDLARADRDIIEREYVEDTRWTKDKIIKYVSGNPTQIFLTKNKVNLGRFGAELGLQVLDEPGCLGFWVKNRSLKKYI